MMKNRTADIVELERVKKEMAKPRITKSVRNAGRGKHRTTDVDGYKRKSAHFQKVSNIDHTFSPAA